MDAIKRIIKSLMGRYKSHQKSQSEIKSKAQAEYRKSTGGRRDFNPKYESFSGAKKYNAILKRLSKEAKKKKN